jgi:hypothetical protein
LVAISHGRPDLISAAKTYGIGGRKFHWNLGRCVIGF